MYLSTLSICTLGSVDLQAFWDFHITTQSQGLVLGQYKNLWNLKGLLQSKNNYTNVNKIYLCETLALVFYKEKLQFVFLHFLVLTYHNIHKTNNKNDFLLKLSIFLAIVATKRSLMKERDYFCFYSSLVLWITVKLQFKRTLLVLFYGCDLQLLNQRFCVCFCNQIPKLWFMIAFC